MAKYELSLTSGNVFSTPVTLTVTPTEGPSVTVSGSSAISTPVELAVLNSIGPRGETGPQGPQGPQGIQGSPGDSVNLQIFDGNIAVGQSVLTTDDVTFNSVTTTGDVTVGGILTAAVSGPFVGDVTVEAGDTLDVSAGTLTLADNQISGDKVEGGTIDAITINTLTSTSISGDLTGDVTGDVTGNLTGNVTGNVTGDVTGNLTGNVTGNVTGDLTGKADTANALTFIVRNSTGATLTKGTAVYVSGIQGNTAEVSPARADSSATMPAFGLVQADIAASGSGVVTTFGSLLGLSVANFGETGVTFSLGDTVYISATEAGKLTNAAPAGEANSIQNIGKIERAVPTTNMTIKVGGAGRTNATPNLDDGDIFIGNSSNQAVTSDLNSEVRSRVSASGDLSYNQATGDFSFTERTDAEVRGLISSTDNGGDGSLSYDNTTGVISYTGPSASEVRAHFSGGTGVTITNGEVAIGQPVATTDDVTFDDVTLTGQLKGPATFTIDPAAHGDDTGTVVVAGNLQVDGTTTTINSTIVEIDDLNLKLAAEATTNAQANGAGITVGDGLANITYNSGTDRWVLDKELSADVVGTVSGDVTGNVTGNLTGNVTGTVSTLTNHDTDDLAEGTTKLYYTDARSRAAISVTDAGGDGSLAYNNTTGVITFTGPSAAEVRAHLSAGGDLSYDSNTGIISFTERTDAEVRQLLSVSGDLSYNSTTGVFSFTERTDAEVRGLVSATDAGGDGSFSYNSTTGVFTYTGPSASEVRAHLSAGGDLSYDSATGVISFTERTDAEVRQLLSVSGDLSYDNTTGVFSFTERTDAEVRGLFSVAGDLSYNSTTGEFSFTERTDAEVRGLVSASGDLSYNSTTGVFSFTERTDAEVRGLVSATDAGGDGSFSYDSATGVFTYTGPSATEVQNHFTGGTGVTITNGDIAIGQAVGTTDNVEFGNATLSGYLAGPATFTIDPAAVGDNTGKVVIAGDLQVDGTTTTVNSTTVEVSDKNVVLGADATADTQNHGAGITVSRPDSTDAGISWDETNDEWDISNGLDVAGNIKVSGTVDGRDIATDGTKLDGIEANADVTDTANVTAAGALMDSEVTNLAQVKAFDSADYATAAQGATADTAVQPNDSPTFGTITADGLTLANATYLTQNDSASGQPRMFGMNSSNITYVGPIDPYAGGAIFYGVSGDVTDQRFFTNSDERLRISSIGDISFYEDTGTTAKFFWDASAERLGIGNTAPTTALDVTGTVTADQYDTDEALPTSNPSLSLDFGNSVQIDPRINFSRASIGTYFDGQYIRTAGPDEPRIEYAADGTVKGLLIEEQRENLVQYSNALSQQTGVRATLTENAAPSPSGSSDAGSIVDTAVAGDHRVDFAAISVTSGTTYTASFFLKANGRDFARVQMGTGGFGTSYANFDLSSNSAGTTTGISGTSITDVGNGWYRYGVTATATATASTVLSIQLATANNAISYTGDGTSGIYVWGVQLEEGSFPTSYIPTNGTEVTREPDIASLPVSEFNYSQSAGTVVVQYDSVAPNTEANRRAFSLVGNAVTEQIALYASTGNFHRGFVIDDGVAIALPVGATGWVENQFYTTALTVDATDATISVDGAAVVTDATGSMPTIDTLALGSQSTSGNYLNGHIRSLKYWPQRLSDATLQAVTQG